MITLTVCVKEFRPQQVGMELTWKGSEPTEAEKALAHELIEMLQRGPQVEGMEKIAGFDIHRPKDN